MNMCCSKVNKGKLAKYTWRYLYNSSSAKIAKLKQHTRTGVFGSDWVSGNSWGSPIVALAPPSKYFGRKCDARLGLNIGADQYFGIKTDEFRWAVVYPPP